MHFGDIFDLPRLSREVGLPIVEWRDVKRPRGENETLQNERVDEIGCWSIWMTSQPSTSNDGGLPRLNSMEGVLGLGKTLLCPGR